MVPEGICNQGVSKTKGFRRDTLDVGPHQVGLGSKPRDIKQRKAVFGWANYHMGGCQNSAPFVGP